MKSIAPTIGVLLFSALLFSATYSFAGSKVGGDVVNEVKAKTITAISAGVKSTAVAGAINIGRE
jgi:hypothetical protein